MKNLYVVYTADPDDPSRFHWDSAWPTKKRAMEEARKYSADKGLAYFKDFADTVDLDPLLTIVVAPQACVRHI